MLNVLITIDTEAHAIRPDWDSDRLHRDIRRDIYGEVGGKRVGLEYQLKVFRETNLKAVFMVDSIFAAVPAVGSGPLKAIVSAIRADGHETQLHLHPEWIPHIPALDVPYRSHLLSAYSESEQVQLLGLALEQLVDAGASSPNCFRAGGFAANRTTLSALTQLGIKFDTSYNSFYAGGICQLPTPKSSGHAEQIEGLQELPVAAFRDITGKLRHCQIGACSSSEIIEALIAAEAAQWDFFVIVSHTFEMLTRRRDKNRPPAVRDNVTRRFERICRFLSANRNRFRTVGFGDLEAMQLASSNHHHEHIKGSVLPTLIRIYEQGFNRLLYR